MLYLGVNADREAMSDLYVPPSLLRDLLDELLAAAQRVAPALDAAMRKDGKKSGEKSARKIPKNVYQAELFGFNPNSLGSRNGPGKPEPGS